MPSPSTSSPIFLVLVHFLARQRIHLVEMPLTRFCRGPATAGPRGGRAEGGRRRQPVLLSVCLRPGHFCRGVLSCRSLSSSAFQSRVLLSPLRSASIHSSSLDLSELTPSHVNGCPSSVFGGADQLGSSTASAASSELRCCRSRPFFGFPLSLREPGRAYEGPRTLISSSRLSSSSSSLSLSGLSGHSQSATSLEYGPLCPATHSPAASVFCWYSSSSSSSSCASPQQHAFFAAVSVKLFFRSGPHRAFSSVSSSSLSSSPGAFFSGGEDLHSDKEESEIREASLRFEQGFEETQLGQDEYGAHSDSPASYVFRVKAAEAAAAETGRGAGHRLLENPKVR